MIELTTLRDFADKHTLRAHCHGCGRSKELDWNRLARPYGWTLPVDELRRRMVCRRCGEKDPILTIAYNRVGGYQYRDWSHQCADDSPVTATCRNSPT